MKTKKIRINWKYEVGATVVLEVPESVTPYEIETAISEGGIISEGVEYYADDQREDFGYTYDAEECPDYVKPDWSCTTDGTDGEDLMNGLRESEIITDV